MADVRDVCAVAAADALTLSRIGAEVAGVGSHRAEDTSQHASVTASAMSSTTI